MFRRAVAPLSRNSPGDLELSALTTKWRVQPDSLNSELSYLWLASVVGEIDTDSLLSCRTWAALGG